MSVLAEEFGIDTLHPIIQADLQKMHKSAEAQWGYQKRYREFSNMISTLNASPAHARLAEHVARTSASAVSAITTETYANFLCAAIADLNANANRRQVQSYRRRYEALSDYISREAA